MTRLEDHPHYNARVNVLAREAAKTFGGTFLTFSDEYPLTEHNAKVRVEPHGETPGYIISFYLPYRQKKIEARLYPYKIDNDVPVREFPHAAMSVERSDQAIMADISRRVVNHPDARPCLLNYEQKVAEKKARALGVLGHIETVTRAIPGMRTSPYYPPGSYQGRVFGVADITINSEGSVRFEHLDGVPLEKAVRILAILSEGK